MKEKQHSCSWQFTLRVIIHRISHLQIVSLFIVFLLFGYWVWYDGIHAADQSNAAEQPIDSVQLSIRNHWRKADLPAGVKVIIKPRVIHNEFQLNNFYFSPLSFLFFFSIFHFNWCLTYLFSWTIIDQNGQNDTIPVLMSAGAGWHLNCQQRWKSTKYFCTSFYQVLVCAE